jgi:hypothetical protein
MEKLRFTIRGALDGVTIAAAPTAFALVDGWTQGTLVGPAGILPAGLYGKVPAGDPYVAHINVLSPAPLAPGDFVELQSGPPVQPRVQYAPSPDNTRLVLVRPTDRLRFVVQAQDPIIIELLIESIGGVNELGSRLADWAAHAAGAGAGARTLTVTAPTVIPAWTGLLHVVHDSINADVITLPPRALVPLDAVLTVTRRGTGVPTLAAAGADRIAVDMMVEQVNRSVTIYNNGDRWALTGV